MRLLAVAALSLLLFGPGTPAEAARLGPFCLSVVPAPNPFFPELRLELFVDSEPYGQVILGTARTLNSADVPSFVTAQVAGQFVRLSIVGGPFLKPAFILGGQIDTQAVPPSGEVTITIADAQVGTILNGQTVPIGSVSGTIAIVACP